MAYRLTKAAEEQIDTVLLRSARIHGSEAAARYAQLLLVLMARLGETPDMLGSVEVPRSSGIRAYPTRLSRLRIEPSRRVGAPRHLVIYRFTSDGVVEILGLAHDRMVLSRAARRMVQDSDER